MKIKEFLACLTAGLLAVLMSGCSIANLDSKDLMRPPRPTGDKAQIQHLIEQNAGNQKYTLKYPQSGNYRSAVILYDMNGDGSEEAIGLYRTKDENPQTHLVVIDEVGEEEEQQWQIVGEFTTAFPEVTEVDFADLNGDGIDEIIVGWNANSTMTNVLSVYSYDNNRCTQISSDEIYYEFAVGDFTQSGFDSIVLINLSTSEKSAAASLYCYNDNDKKITLVSEAAMDSEVTRLFNVTSGKVDSTGTFAVFADGVTGLRYNTQVIYFDVPQFQLKSETVQSGLISEYDSINLKSTAIVSKDINGDGIVEIPVCTKMPSDSSSTGMEYAGLISWCNYSTTDNNTEILRTVVYNNKGGYYYIIPDEWYGHVTAVISDDGRTMTFMEYSDGVIGKVFFALRQYPVGEWIDGADMDGYSLILKNENNAYGYVLMGDSAYIPKEQDILNSFRAAGTGETVF